MSGISILLSKTVDQLADEILPSRHAFVEGKLACELNTEIDRPID